MGGLRKELPVVFWTFLIGSGALAAVPLVTAGFYSKDMIIWQVYASTRGGALLWAGAIAGALLTSMYTFRMVTLTFFGPLGKKVSRLPGWRMSLPLMVLAVLSVIAGFVDVPNIWGGVPVLSVFLEKALPAAVLTSNLMSREGLFEIFSGLVSLGGIVLIILLIRGGWSGFTEKLAGSETGEVIHRLWFAGWGFDRVYDLLLVNPYVRLARINRNDAIDLVYRGMGSLTKLAWRGLIVTENGRVRSYALGIALGAVIIIGLAVFL
jgi:NADH-quinone oxidoreductase subunit L